jgi:hypothetical protein
MPKLPECESCLLCAHSPYLICTIHPTGVAGDSCLDYRQDPNAEVEEPWEPEGASYYNGELIVQPRQRWTREEQLWLLDNHPMFTGTCPQCGYRWAIGNYPMSQWECPECNARGDGWEVPGRE